ncbi:MAG: arsenate reductase, glutathione/glutaredoxin type [Limnothrix sp.]
MKNVMFVCRRNSCRSQMAEGFARQLAQGKVAIASSGLVASRVHPTAIAVMADVGIDLTTQTSDCLSDFDPERFDIVVSMCGCGVNLPEAWLTRAQFADWDLPDPDGQPLAVFHEVRDEIQRRVEALINESSD